MKLKNHKSAGMTLVEIIVTLSVAGVLLAGATTFYLKTCIGHHLINQRIDQALIVRRFTQELIYNATRANQVFLYKSQVTATDWNLPTDILEIDVDKHPAGDFVVFVFYEYPKPSAQTYHRIRKIIGYYLDAPAGGIGAIRRITIDLSKNLRTGVATLADQVSCYDTTNAKTMIEQVMIDNWTSSAHARVDTFSLHARGLFKSETVTESCGRLFYYRDAQLSMMVAGQLYATSATDSRYTYTDTFNFSITPRS